MKAICYTYTDPTPARLGTLVAVVRPDYTHWDSKKETEDEFLQRTLAKHRLAADDARDFQFIEESEIPDKSFRNAWEQGDKSIGVNMPKARDLHREALRVLRAPKFGPIETAQRSAFSRDDKVQAAALEAQLQALRDVTADPAIEAAQTPEELKAVMPAVLLNGSSGGAGGVKPKAR